VISLILIVLAAYLFINVHRRKRAEKELTREKEFMEQLFENSPEGIVLLDNRDNIIRANREMGNLFRVPVDEMINSSINSVVVGTPEMLEEARRLSNRVLQGQEFTIETERQRSDGTNVPVSISGMPFRVDDELMVYGIYRDISERKRAEEKLRKRLNFEEFISRTSSRIVFGTEMDELINESLVDLCGIIQASRGCLVFFEDVPKGLEIVRRWAFRDEKLLPEDDEIPAPRDDRPSQGVRPVHL
jgi:PAS domain S-box-containing protein